MTNTTNEEPNKKSDFWNLIIAICISAFISFNFGAIHTHLKYIDKMSKINMALEMCKAVVGGNYSQGNEQPNFDFKSTEKETNI